MKLAKPHEIINKLLSISQIIDTSIEYDRPYISFGIKDPIAFIGHEALIKKNEYLDTLYRNSKDIYETVSQKELENKVITLLRNLKKEEKECTPAEYQAVVDAILKLKVQDFEILYEFYGADMNRDYIEFGDFTIYNVERSMKKLEQKFPQLKNKQFYIDDNLKLLVGIKTRARDNTKAIELADRICDSIENCFNFIIGDLKHKYRVGILNFRVNTSVKKVICNKGAMGINSSRDVYMPVNLDDKLFQEQGNNKLWGLITKENKNVIEKRLLTAVEWIGKGLIDTDKSKALVQFVFAIEGMLQIAEKAIITPSIVSQLSDWLAFIIQDEKNERKKIAKLFKDTYQKRSAIAHGGQKEITLNDLEIAHQLAKMMVITFLTYDPYKEMTSIEQLSERMADLKFQ